MKLKMERKGYGQGKGKGYKNLIQLDPYIHTLSAKGVKTKKSKTPNLDMMRERTDMMSVLSGKGFRKSFGLLPTPQKKGLIRELAKKVTDGVSWAVEWEKEHLPQQQAWVKKEFEQAKEQAIKLEEAGKKKLEEIKENLQKKKDLDDVRDELDTNNDGVQDIPLSKLQEVNTEIVADLDTIDTDNNGVPDHREEGFTNINTIETPELPSYTEPSEGVLTNKPIAPIPFMTGEPEPKPEPETKMVAPEYAVEPEYKVEYDTPKVGLPIPLMTGKDLEPPKPKKTFISQTGELAKKGYIAGKEFAQKEIEAGKRYIQQRKEETRELHQLPYAELRQLAISEGQGAFGMNKYEQEIFRREKEQKYLDQKIKEIREGKPTSGGGFGAVGSAFGFLNPVATLTQPVKAKTSSESTSAGLGDSLSFLNPLTAFKPSVKSVPKNERYYNTKLKPKLQQLNDGFEPLGFLNPVETISKRRK